MPPPAALVVPCYNEEHRLQPQSFIELLRAEHDLRLVFVDDGSVDGTGQHLQTVVAASHGRASTLRMDRNRGKAEAVREGLQQVMADGAQVVGYVDADLATPASELRRLLSVFRSSDAKALLASRVALLGRDIRRNPARHYLGRVFATAASYALELPVYDTQCGAKLFRRTPALEAALTEPFLSRWLLDIELLGRMLATPPGVPSLASTEIVEEPVMVWHDVPGSKVTAFHALIAVRDLARVSTDLARRRRGARR